MQLERIARTTIQLERIQNTIDASFEKSRTQTNATKNLIASLEMTSEEQTLLEKSMLGITTEDFEADEKIAIANQVGELKDLNAMNQLVVLETAPFMCAYLFRKSQEKNISIDDFINKCVLHAKWTPIPRQSGQSERSDAGVLV